MTVEDSIVTSETVLSVLPPTEPIESPCPPEQVPPVKIMLCGFVSSIQRYRIVNIPFQN